VSQQVAALKRMKKMLPYEMRKTIYMSFIAPHFNYCAESWHFCSKTSATKVEKVNERAIRFAVQGQEHPLQRPSTSPWPVNTGRATSIQDCWLNF